MRVACPKTDFLMTKFVMAFLALRGPKPRAPHRKWLINGLVWLGLLFSASGAAAGPPENPCGQITDECSQSTAAAAAQAALDYYQRETPSVAPIIAHSPVQPGSEFASYCVRWTQPATHVGCYYQTHYRARTFQPEPSSVCTNWSLRMTCTRAMARAAAEAMEHYYKERSPGVKAYVADYGFDQVYRWGSYCVRWTTPSGCFYQVFYGDPIKDYEPEKSLGSTCGEDAPPVVTPSPSCGNPINFTIGNKHQTEVDIDVGGLSFVRYYNSDRGARSEDLGHNWTHTYSRRLKASVVSGVERVEISRADGKSVRFTLSAGQWLADADVVGRLRKFVDGSIVSWQYNPVDASRAEHFDHLGRLISVEERGVETLSLEYNSGQIENTLSDFRLTSVTATSGRRLDFQYDLFRRIAEVSDASGVSTHFAYDSAGRLSTVTHADDSGKTYVYNEQAHTSGADIPWALTGVVDERGNRFATYRYDANGRAYSTEHAGGTGRFSISYPQPGTSIITTPDGAVRTVSSATLLGVKRVVQSVTTCTGCTPRTTSYTYDSSGRVDSSTDSAGVITTYAYDDKSRIALRVEATNHSDEKRSTSTDWHPQFNRPSEQRLLDSAGSLVGKTQWTYDNGGRTLTQSIVNPLNGVQRTQTFEYCSADDAADPGQHCPIVGLPKKFRDRANNASDSIQLNYYTSTDLSGCDTGLACHYRGDLKTVVNALGQATTYARYDRAGRPSRVVDASGVATDIEYGSRGWVTARKVRGADDGVESDDAITRVEYDVTGQVAKLIQPDGAFITFSYDAAHRLVGITDSLGNTIGYSLDAAGNRIQEETRDSGGALRHSLARVFDQLGQLETLADAQANGTVFTYDATGKVESVTDALGRTSDNDYDALGRLRRSIGNLAGAGAERAETQFEYDARDNLVAVIDPKGLSTAYTYDGLGDLVGLQSPDTGATTYAYDNAGNRIRQQDARGVESLYSYDALNRLIGVDLPTEGQNIGFGYDAAPAVCQNGERFAVGRLSGFTDASGNTDYCYDRSGNVVRKVQTTSAGPVRTVRYQHNAAGRVMSVTYPSGLVLTYTRNAAGQVTAVTAKNSASEAPVALVTDVNYLPFGPLTGLTFDNGRVLSKSYDLNYDIASVTDNAANGLNIGYSLNDVGSIVGLAERQNSGTTVARTVEYDGLDRLTALKTGTAPVQAFTYDATGNRTSRRSGTGSTSNYLYAADSHRLTKVGSQNRAYDAVGNSTTIHTRNYTYDDRGRMQQSRNGNTVLRNYRYNALGQRVAKLHPTTATSSVFYVYDEAGKLLGEYRPNGALIKEYLWLDDTLVAVRGGYSGHKFQYVLTDHLNTPRAIVLPATNTIIWRWDLGQTAFGDHAAQNNPDGDTANYVFNLRYPGQYLDSETGLHYNYFRDYDPSTGRYVQSDPIGLEGGLSMFSYGAASPLKYSDPLGLEILIQAHPVALGLDHTKLTLIPNDQARWKNHPHFKNRLPDGRAFATMGAGPEQGRLVSEINRERDVKFVLNGGNTFSEQCVNFDQSRSENELIEALLIADSKYADHLDYEYFPGSFSNGHNSNSYVSGLLRAAGFFPHGTSYTPGYGKPVPASEFGVRP